MKGPGKARDWGEQKGSPQGNPLTVWQTTPDQWEDKLEGSPPARGRRRVRGSHLEGLTVTLSFSDQPPLIPPLKLKVGSD